MTKVDACLCISFRTSSFETLQPWYFYRSEGKVLTLPPTCSYFLLLHFYFLLYLPGLCCTLQHPGKRKSWDKIKAREQFFHEIEQTTKSTQCTAKHPVKK